MKEGKCGICRYESAYFMNRVTLSSFGHFSTNDLIKLHHVCTYNLLLIHSSTDKNPRCFYNLIVVDSTAIIMDDFCGRNCDQIIAHNYFLI